MRVAREIAEMLWRGPFKGSVTDNNAHVLFSHDPLQPFKRKTPAGTNSVALKVIEEEDMGMKARRQYHISAYYFHKLLFKIFAFFTTQYKEVIMLNNSKNDGIDPVNKFMKLSKSLYTFQGFH